LFLSADGKADKAWSNETIRWHPEEQWLEIKLPPSLAHLANRPHGRWRLSCPVAFSHRDDEVAAQAATGALLLRRLLRPRSAALVPGCLLEAAEHENTADRRAPRPGVLGVDLNAGHLAAVVLDRSGSPVGTPATISLELSGLPATTRDVHLRRAISQLLQKATDAGCPVIAIEDLDFARAKSEGREHTGRRLSRGRKGRRFRGLVAGIPTAAFRDGLVQMATNRGIFVIAVDPAYTSRWGAEHWLGVLRKASAEAGGHHCAALVIARRGLGQRARRRGGCDSTPPEDGQERATDSAVQPSPEKTAGLPEVHQRKPGNPEARGRPQQRRRTQPADGHLPGDQVTQDRSGHPPAGLTPGQRLGTVG